MSVQFTTRPALRAWLAPLVLAALAMAQPPEAQSAQDPTGVEEPAEAITRLIGQYQKSTKLEEKIKICQAVILLDPNQAFCTGQLFIDQKAMEEQKKAEAAKQQQLQADQQKKVEAQKDYKSAQSAFGAGKFNVALDALRRARSADPNNKAISSFETLVSSRLSLFNNIKYFLAGSLTVMLGAIVFGLFRLRRGRSPVLEMVDGAMRKRSFPLDKDSILIGSAEKDGSTPIDIVIPDEAKVISPLHCEIHRDAEGWILIDSSVGGTWLNGRRIPFGRPVPLRRGNLIHLAADCSLRMKMERKKS